MGGSVCLDVDNTMVTVHAMQATFSGSVKPQHGVSMLCGLIESN